MDGQEQEVGLTVRRISQVDDFQEIGNDDGKTDTLFDQKGEQEDKQDLGEKPVIWKNREASFQRGWRRRSAGVLPIALIIPNPEQPRVEFNEQEINDMAQTMKIKGDVIIPILVTPRSNRYMIKDGERRWRAAKKIGLTRISVIVEYGLDDITIFIDSMIANRHKKSLNTMEEVAGFIKVMKEKGWTQAELCRRMGIRSGTLANLLRARGLHEEFQAMLLYGKVKPGPILHLASFAKDVQQSLFEELERRIKNERGGKWPSSSVVAGMLRKIAEEQGIEAQRPKRGDRPHTYAEIHLKRIARTMEGLSKGLSELSNINKERLMVAKNPNAVSVCSQLGFLLEIATDAHIELKEKLGLET